MKDLIIIGSGPAGLSAALTAKRRNLDFIWFGNKDLSKKVYSAHKISNYPGLIEVSGDEMLLVFQKQIEHEGLEIAQKKVNSIMKFGDNFMVSASNEVFESKTVLLALGVELGKGIDGEEAFVGKGVSYCATCDGMFYKGKNIAVVCTNKNFEEEIEFLAGIVNHIDAFISYESDLNLENVSIYKEKPLAIKGETKADAFVYKGNDGQEKLLNVDGVFILKDSQSGASLINGLEMEGPHIIVNRKQETNIEGLYAAGDCTGLPYQYAKAVGEGNVAISSITSYIASEK